MFLSFKIRQGRKMTQMHILWLTESPESVAKKKWVLKGIVPEHDMETESFLFPPRPGSFDKQQYCILYLTGQLVNSFFSTMKLFMQRKIEWKIEWVLNSPEKYYCIARKVFFFFFFLSRIRDIRARHFEEKFSWQHLVTKKILVTQ